MASLKMPMFFLQFEVRPKPTHPKRDRYAGAMVNCWVMRETESEADAVARGWISDQHWLVTRSEGGSVMTKAKQAEHPEGMPYFEQAEIDREVFVFHTWPVGAPDATNV